MCHTADTIFDGGLSDIRGDREYQRSRGYSEPVRIGGATTQVLDAIDARRKALDDVGAKLGRAYGGMPNLEAMKKPYAFGVPRVFPRR